MQRNSMELKVKNLIFLIILSVFTLNAEKINSNDICFVAPRIDQIKEIMEFDYRVSFEFFKPLYLKHYSHFEFGKNPDFYLEEEIKNDESFFEKCIQDQELESRLKESQQIFFDEHIGKDRLLIAFDNKNQCIGGLISFSKNNDVLTLELLLVDKKYRKQGIGKKLVKCAIETFKDIKEAIVYPVRFGNENTLKFYESLGFVNLGFGPKDKKNAYGISYEEMHFYYKLVLKK